MTLIAELVVSLLLIVGGIFALIGSWGLVRLPSLMTRLHGPTKATTLGVGGCLVASMIYFPTIHGTYSAHELLIALFLFLTAPISANLIAKAHLHEAAAHGSITKDGKPEEQARLPATGTGVGWATFWDPGSAGGPARQEGAP